MYNPHETYMANMMARDGYLEHAGWQNHKYINKFMKGGRWVYQYANDAVGKVTGSYYKNQMDYNNKASLVNKKRMGNTTGKAYDLAKKNYQANKAAAIDNRRKYENSAGQRIKRSISALRESSKATFDRGRNALSSMFGNSAAGKLWDKHVTGKYYQDQGALASKRARNTRGTDQGKYWTTKAVAAGNDYYNKSLKGRWEARKIMKNR